MAQATQEPSVNAILTFQGALQLLRTGISPSGVVAYIKSMLDPADREQTR